MKAAFACGLFLVVFITVLAGEDNPSSLLARFECADRVSSVAFSSDGKLLAAGYGWRSQGGVTVWNVSDRTIAHSWKSEKHDDDTQVIRNVAFSPDGKLLAAATWDGDLLLWNLDHWGPPKAIKTDAGSPSGLAFNPESELLALSGDKAVILYDVRTWKQQPVFTSPSPIAKPIAAGFLSDGKTLLFCKNGSLEFWDSGTAKSIKSLKSGGWGFICAVSPKGTYVVSGGGAVYRPKLVEIWNQTDEHPIAQLTQFRDGVFAAAVDRAESILAIGGGNYGTGGNLSLWSMDTKKEIGFVSVGRFPLESLAFSPGGDVLAAGSGDAEVLLFSVDQLRGPQVAMQDKQLCGEILVEGDHLYIRPITMVPLPMSGDFGFAAKLQIADQPGLAELAGEPVVLEEWALEKLAGNEQARVIKSHRLLTGSKDLALASFAVFGDVQNPGWNRSTTIKIYGDGSFVATDPNGTCLAFGALGKSVQHNSFQSIKRGLINDGFLMVKKDPLTRGLDHFRTRFIALAMSGNLEIRSDGEKIDETYLNRAPTQKEQDFARVFESQKPLIDAILHAGMALPETPH